MTLAMPEELERLAEALQREPFTQNTSNSIYTNLGRFKSDWRAVCDFVAMGLHCQFLVTKVSIPLDVRYIQRRSISSMSGPRARWSRGARNTKSAWKAFWTLGTRCSSCRIIGDSIPICTRRHAEWLMTLRKIHRRNHISFSNFSAAATLRTHSLRAISCRERRVRSKGNGRGSCRAPVPGCRCCLLIQSWRSTSASVKTTGRFGDVCRTYLSISQSSKKRSGAYGSPSSQRSKPPHFVEHGLDPHF